MGKKLVTIGDQSWGVADADVAKVMSDIEHAMTTGGSARLSLLADGRPVSVFLNGRTAATVVVDDGGEGLPTEISGRNSRPTEISGL
jgi:hypothetical protein